MALATLKPGRKNQVFFLLSTLLSTVLQIYIYYPGDHSIDLRVLHSLSLKESVNDFHAPGTSFFLKWFVADEWYQQVLFLLPQLFLFLSFVVLSFYEKFGTFFALIYPPCFFFFPIICSWTTIPGKDSLFSSAVFLSVAFLYAAHRSRAVIFGIVSLLLLFLATFIRVDGVVISLVLLGPLSGILFQQLHVTKSQTVNTLMRFVCLAILFFSARHISYDKLPIENGYPFQQLAYFDLFGIAKMEDTPKLTIKGQDISVQERYSSYGVNHLFWTNHWPYYPECLLEIPLGASTNLPSILPYVVRNECNDSRSVVRSCKMQPLSREIKVPSMLAGDDDSLEYYSLINRWSQAVLYSPMLYLKHRYAFYRNLIELSSDCVCDPLPMGVSFQGRDNYFSYTNQLFSTRYMLNRTVRSINYYFRNTILFRPYFYVALIFVALLYTGIFLSVTKKTFVVSLLSSALMQSLGLAIYGINCGPRFFLWPIFALALMPYFLFCRDSCDA